MIIEKELRKLLHQLVKKEVAQIDLGNSQLTVHVFDKDKKILISSSVYFGGNYISKSVRSCLTQTPPFGKGHINTFFTIDEENYQVSLKFLGALEHLNKRMFVDLLEEFSWLADEWRLHLDEHDKNDLIYVRVPKSG